MAADGASLLGRRVVITGAARGFGRTIAHAFAKAGAGLLLVSRNRAQLESTLAELAHPDRHQVCVCDVTAADAPDRIFSGAWSHCDVLVNNAAIQGPIGPLWENSPEEWRALILADLVAPVSLMQAAIPGMINRGWGRIINISGGGATGPRPRFTAYAAAKTALARVTETVAAELSGTGVTVNSIAPGTMGTAMLEAMKAAGPENAGEKEAAIAARFTEREAMPGIQAAALCVYLAAEDASDISGKLIAALWDPWETLHEHAAELSGGDIYTLRRILPAERGKSWGERS